MKRRKLLILENKILLASVDVDQMDRILLNDQQPTTAKNALFEYRRKIKDSYTPKEKNLKIFQRNFSLQLQEVDVSLHLLATKYLW